MGADEAMGLHRVDTSQLWAYGQEALRVQLGPRHPYLSLSLAGPMSFCLQKIRVEPVAVPRPSWKVEAASFLLCEHWHSRSGPSQSLSSSSQGTGLCHKWESLQALLGATDSQLFSSVQRIIQSFLLPATQYPIITMARDAICTYRLKTLR